MSDIQPIQRGFTKQAQLYGLSVAQANQLFKQAMPTSVSEQPGFGAPPQESIASLLGQGVQQVGSWLDNKAEKGADMFKDFRAQNPAAMDAGIGGLIGGSAGSIMAGPQNRGKGALMGAAAGAGLGGLGMHPGALQQLQQQLGAGQ